MVLGPNSTGKSSLAKSLYWALGADPARVHGTWESLNVVALLTFTINGDRFRILRTGNRFGLFDARDRLIAVTNSLSTSLAPRLGHMLGFGLTLTTQQGSTQIATPAFCFLPYYIDQDEGWQQPWSSFDRLGQFKNWKQDTVDYHSGVKPKAYYELTGEKVALDTEIAKQRAEREALDRAFKKVQSSQKTVSPPIDTALFRQEVARLVDEVSALQTQRADITAKLSVAESHRAVLEQQLGIAQSALGELDKDFKFAESLDGDALQCPLCGTEHHNSFANRFSLGDDQQQCRILIQTLQSELDEARSKTAALLREVEARNFRVAKINALLQTKRGKWRLHDLIDAEGQRRAFDLLAKELDVSGEALGKLLFQLDSVKRRLKQLTDPKRKKEIDAYYSQEMIRLLARLNVRTLPPAEAERIRLTLHNTGSDQPRTVLAYYLAFLATMRKYGSTPSCPMIIDTPHQQDQDAANAKRIVECILESQPKDEQLILVAVSLHGAKHEGEEIHLTEPQRLLKPDQYENVGRVFAPFFDQMAHAGSG